MPFRSPSRVNSILQAAAGLRDYAREAQRLAELTEIASRVLPDAIRPAVTAGRLREGTLFLLAGNAAVAAKLRQFAPRLLASYRRSGWQVTEIRVAVQVSPNEARRVAPTPQLSPGTAKELSKLAARVADPGLQAALHRLARHAAPPGTPDQDPGPVSPAGGRRVPQKP
ncbi:MAG: DciA family protein [Burkholderiales bacterium]